MKGFVINGRKGAVPQPIRYGRNETGLYSVVPFEGTSTEVKARAAQYDALGAIYEVEELHGGRARLTVYLTYATAQQIQNEVPVDMWELDPQEVEKDLLDCDFPNSLLPSISKDDRKSLGVLIANPGFVWDGANPTPDVNGETVVIADLATCYTLYLLMSAGVRSFPIDAHVIRHTQTVSNRYATQVSFLNVGRILSRASFIALEGVPSDLLFSVPIAPTPSQFIETAGDLQYGWRKLRPQVQEAALQKRQIVNSYIFGLWPVNLFGSVI